LFLDSCLAKVLYTLVSNRSFREQIIYHVKRLLKRSQKMYRMLFWGKHREHDKIMIKNNNTITFIDETFAK